MKKIVLINGHPDSESFNYQIMEAYRKSALRKGNMVEEIRIGELYFDPNLEHGFKRGQPLEEDLQRAWNKIKEADHLVWIFPIWWGGWPAIMKGFVDRVYLPGEAFKFKKDSPWWDKYLQGKTAHIIATMDFPVLMYKWFYGQPAIRQLRDATLKFCGVTPVKVTLFGQVRKADFEKRQLWLRKIEMLAGK